MIKSVIASDFASLADLKAYHEAKSKGWSDKQAFKVGDNGIGYWGDLTAQTHTPMCALPPEDMIEAWGSIEDARHARVLVVSEHKVSVECVLADRMPHRKNITNSAGIDLNPAAIDALGMDSPVMARVTWGPIRNAQRA